ncbi:MAG: hypothetical protein ABL993_05345 [Vicinamibacterales bacterium]
MVKQLDPSTATVEDLAQASRSLRLANQVALGICIAVAVVTFFLVVDSDYGGSPVAMLIICVAAGLAYRVTYEVLSRVLPPK